MSSASHLHLYNIAMRRILSYRDHGTRAHFLGVSAACDEVWAGHFGSRKDCLPDQQTSAPCADMSRYTRDYGRASSWFNRDWAPPAKQHTKNSNSGWSKWARGYQSDYEDRSRHWEDNKPNGPSKENEGVSEAVAVAEARLWRTATRIWDGPLRTTLQAVRQRIPLGTAGATATDKEATRSRLEELHRLLKNSKASLCATYNKNAEANDRAYDLNLSSCAGMFS